MKTMFQGGLNEHVPVPPEKRFLIPASDTRWPVLREATRNGISRFWIAISACLPLLVTGSLASDLVATNSVPAADAYTHFADLASHENEGVAYRVRAKSRPGIAVMAPHGGGIEFGTTEIAEGVAGTNFAFYAFEGLLSSDNRRLHVTSTRFDEPSALYIATNAVLVVTIHGEGSDNEVVYMGGRDTALRDRIAVELRKVGFDVQVHPRKELQGLSRDNLCNRGTSGLGVQIELSAGLRRACFRTPDGVDRREPTARFAALVESVRSALMPHR